MVLVSAMNKDQRYEWLTDLLANMFELDKSAMSLDSNLYADLDIDSIDAVDLAATLRQLTGKRLAPDVFKTIRTIGDVVAALAALAALTEERAA